MTASVPLTELEPDVAAAVVAVLSRAGLPAVVGGPADGPGSADGAHEVVVLVPEERREEALQRMAASMEAIGEELQRRRGREPGPVRGSAVPEADEDEEGRPLVFERLRRLSFLPILLVPLLVVTLASVRIPVAVALVIVVGGMAALHAWRDGRRSREG